METLFAFGSLSDLALLIGLAVTRIAVAFLLIPIFTSELIPAMIRNAIFIALALLIVAVQPVIDVKTMTSLGWLKLFFKEAFIGLVIGFFFGAILWAFEAAGQIIDTKVGATMASIVDPLSGHQTSLTGAFLGRLANFVFMFSGGLMLLTGTIIESYGLWPIASELPDLKRLSVTMFEAEFGRLMLLMLAIAAPALVLLFLIDAVLGLINRYAQQLNVFSLSMSIKAWASTAIVLLMLGVIVQLLVSEIAARPQLVMNALRLLLPR